MPSYVHIHFSGRKLTSKSPSQRQHIYRVEICTRCGVLSCHPFLEQSKYIHSPWRGIPFCSFAQCATVDLEILPNWSTCTKRKRWNCDEIYISTQLHRFSTFKSVFKSYLALHILIRTLWTHRMTTRTFIDPLFGWNHLTPITFEFGQWMWSIWCGHFIEKLSNNVDWHFKLTFFVKRTVFLQYPIIEKKRL